MFGNMGANNFNHLGGLAGPDTIEIATSRRRSDPFSPDLGGLDGPDTSEIATSRRRSDPFSPEKEPEKRSLKTNLMLSLGEERKERPSFKTNLMLSLGAEDAQTVRGRSSSLEAEEEAREFRQTKIKEKQALEESISSVIQNMLGDRTVHGNKQFAYRMNTCASQLSMPFRDFLAGFLATIGADSVEALYNDVTNSNNRNNMYQMTALDFDICFRQKIDDVDYYWSKLKSECSFDAPLSEAEATHVLESEASSKLWSEVRSSKSDIRIFERAFWDSPLSELNGLKAYVRKMEGFHPTKSSASMRYWKLMDLVKQLYQDSEIENGVANARVSDALSKMFLDNGVLALFNRLIEKRSTLEEFMRGALMPFTPRDNYRSTVGFQNLVFGFNPAESMRGHVTVQMQYGNCRYSASLDEKTVRSLQTKLNLDSVAGRNLKAFLDRIKSNDHSRPIALVVSSEDQIFGILHDVSSIMPKLKSECQV